MSTILGEPEVINGVADTEAGLVVVITVKDSGAVAANVSFIAGSELDAGISATVTPTGKVTTCEFGSEPAVITAGQASRVLPPKPAEVNAEAFTPVPQNLKLKRCAFAEEEFSLSENEFTPNAARLLGRFTEVNRFGPANV